MRLLRQAGPGVRPRGFTLMELLVVVVVIGILAAIAIPSYSQYVARGQRSAAKAALLQASGFLERNYTNNGCYNYGTPQECQNQAGALLTLLAGFQYAPTDGSAATYQITSTLAAQTFTLTATPCGAGGSCPAGSNNGYTDSDCGALGLTNTGARSSNGTLAAEQCWSR